jgi:hypothetical protein
MKIVRKLSPNTLRRFKMTSMLTLAVIAFSMLTNQAVMSQELFDSSGADDYNGQYVWLG